MDPLATPCDFEILIVVIDLSLGGFLSFIFIVKFQTSQFPLLHSVAEKQINFFVQSSSKTLARQICIIANQNIMSNSINKTDLFLSSPRRNPASASAAKRLPVPASSFGVTAYSLTNACLKVLLCNEWLPDLNTELRISTEGGVWTYLWAISCYIIESIIL